MTAVPTRGARVTARRGAVAARRSGPARRTSLTQRWTGSGAPWDVRDLTRSARLVSAGFLGLVVCWFVMSGKADWRDQIGWLAGAMAALLVAGVGMVSWLVTGMRQVHGEMAEVMTVVRVVRLGLVAEPEESDDFLDDVDGPALPAGEALATVRETLFVTNDSMTRIHRADCALVRGKSVRVASDDEFVSRGLKLCGVCCGE